MIQTLRQAISDIINDLRAYNLDDKFSFRFLANKLKGKIELFIKQDSDLRVIFNINEVWKPLPCIVLEDADYNNCSSFYEACDVLKRSKKKIPSTYTGRYGNFIKILNINNSVEYTQIKSFQYKDIKRREYSSNKIKYFWIEEGFLYIPDVPNLEEVRGIGLFKDAKDADIFNGKCDVCPKPLDAEILAPDYILDLAKSQTVAELLKSARVLPEDALPDLNSNKKTNQ